MFTGIIEHQGKILANVYNGNANHLVISTTFVDLHVGESIGVNGVCLTLLPSKPGELNFDVSPETLRVTSLGTLTSGDLVNLERAMQAETRFGGHYVSGHVDTKAYVQSIRQIGEYIEMELAGFNANDLLYLIPKGSITVDGVSLTINETADQVIKLMLVPHTISKTTLGSLKMEQQVNIEFDYLARIVAHQLQSIKNINLEVIL